VAFRPSSEDYKLNPESFYLEYGKRKPEGRGYEIIILNYDEIMEWHQKERKLVRYGNLVNLHIHVGDDSKQYVCYPFQIKTKDEAIRLFKEWARIMFAQIFFGLSDSFLYGETKSLEMTKWAEFIDDFLFKKGITIKDIL
jgi:hypothetical protein